MRFWTVWSASALSNLADGVLKVAVPLVAIGYTRSPVLIAGLVVAFSLPWLVFVLFAGVIVDRGDRRVLMIAADATRAVVVAVLVFAVASDLGSIGVLYAIAFGVGLAETVHDIAAQAIVPGLVPDAELTRANGRLYAVELTTNEFAGPPLAGALVAVGAVLALAVPAGLWVLAAFVLLLLRGSFRPQRERGAVRAEITEGLRFLWRNRMLRAFTAVVGIFNFASSATMAVLVLYAVGAASAMGLSAAGYGLLLTTYAVGSVLGSLVAGRVVGLVGQNRAILGGLAVGCALIGVPAVTADPVAVGAVFAVGGAAIMVFNVEVVSLRQRLTPDELRGRVQSGHRMVAWGSMPLGALTGGLIAELVGLRVVFAVMAVVALAALPVLARALRGGQPRLGTRSP